MTENLSLGDHLATAEPPSRDGLHIGSDGITRCSWAGDDPLYQAYHDVEWGRPLHGENHVFEKISLEGFQAGLSWITILRRREAFREVFANFDVDTVAHFVESDVAVLMADSRIIRNRAKIEATIGNAKAVQRLRAESPNGVEALDELLWAHRPLHSPRPAPHTRAPAATAESTALSIDLKKRGFRFVGPTTCYALMQSGGLVNDHVTGCFAGDDIDAA